MIDNLKDLITHTHDLGCFDLIKITGTLDDTKIEGLAEDKSVILYGQYHTPVSEFEGVFGIPNLAALKTKLGLEIYQEDPEITVTKDANGNLNGIHIENTQYNFQNDHRFMLKEIVEEKLKSVSIKIQPTWHIEIEPSEKSIQWLKFQSIAHPNENTFMAETDDNNNLIFYFGDHSTHSGNFIFATGVNGKIKNKFHWPISRVLSILNLAGDKVFRMSDDGAMQIIVDSGLGEYTYILPAQSK